MYIRELVLHIALQALCLASPDTYKSKTADSVNFIFPTPQLIPDTVTLPLNMAAPIDISPLYATTACVYAICGAECDVSLPKWDYCSFLLVYFDDDGSTALFIRKSPCPLCDFPGQLIASTFVDRSSFSSNEPARTITWTPTGATDRVMIKFCLEEDFWAVVDDISQAKLRPTKSISPSLDHFCQTVYDRFSHLALLVSPGTLPIQRVQEGWPAEADMAVSGCWCEESSYSK